MKVFKIVCLIAVLTACQHMRSFDVLIDKHFTSAEKKNLNDLTLFVDKHVVNKTGEKDIANAYLNYFKKEYSSTFSSEDYNDIFSLSQNAFSQIWVKSTPLNVVYADSITIEPDNIWYLNLNKNGNYMKMLKELGESSKFYNEFCQNFEKYDIYYIPLYASKLQKNPELLDFKNEIDHLWAAIFIISLEVYITSPNRRP